MSDHEILTGSADCNVRRYDIRSGELISDFIGSKLLSRGIHICTHLCRPYFFHINQLQSVVNAVAWLISGVPRFWHISSFMGKELHCLPIENYIE